MVQVHTDAVLYNRHFVFVMVEGTYVIQYLYGN